MSIPIIYIVSLTLMWLLMAILMVRRFFSAPTFFLALGYYIVVLSAVIYIFDVGNERSRNLGIDGEASLLLQAIIVSIFSLALIFGYHIGRYSNPLKNVLPVFDASQHDGLVLLGIFLLTVGSFLVAGMPLAGSGGDIAGAIHNIRHEEALKGLHFLKQFNRLGTLLAAAYWVSLLQRRRGGQSITKARIWLVATLFMVNFLSGSIFGGKNFLIYPLLILVVCYAAAMLRRPIVFLTSMAVVLITFLGALQYYRVAVIANADYHPVHHTITAMGLSLMDNNQIFLQTMTSPQHTTTGEDFFNGLAGVIPRSLWAGKPDQITAGGRFKDIVVPGGQGGWPPFGFNQWYANFGWPGVMIGGLLSGLVLAALALRYRHAYQDPFAMAFALYLTIMFLVPGGLGNMMFVKYVQNIVPLFIFKALSQKALVPSEITKQPSGGRL